MPKQEKGRGREICGGKLRIICTTLIHYRLRRQAAIMFLLERFCFESSPATTSAPPSPKMSAAAAILWAAFVSSFSIGGLKLDAKVPRHVVASARPRCTHAGRFFGFFRKYFAELSARVVHRGALQAFPTVRRCRCAFYKPSHLSPYSPADQQPVQKHYIFNIESLHLATYTLTH